MESEISSVASGTGWPRFRSACNEVNAGSARERGPYCASFPSELRNCAGDLKYFAMADASLGSTSMSRPRLSLMLISGKRSPPCHGGIGLKICQEAFHYSMSLCFVKKGKVPASHLLQLVHNNQAGLAYSGCSKR